jgi:hypothetical protein
MLVGWKPNVGFEEGLKRTVTVVFSKEAIHYYGLISNFKGF